MKHIIIIVAAALLFAVCAAPCNAQAVEYSEADLAMLKDAANNYNENNNSITRPMQNGNRLTNRAVGFVHADIFAHDGRKYAIVSTEDSANIACADCSRKQWPLFRDRQLRSIKAIGEMSEAFDYTVDDERMRINTAMPGMLFGVFRDDGHWRVYRNPEQTEAPAPVLECMRKQEREMRCSGNKKM